MTNGDASILIESPISIGLWLAAAAMVLLPLLMRHLSQRQAKATLPT
jgi:putative tricarboxylic transport membrane protein